MRVLGAVLAGGQSRRFGSDKALAVRHDRTLIAHVIDAVRPSVDAILVCGRDWPGETSVPDRPRPDLGPLGGLNAALAFGANKGFARVLSVPCDLPVIPRTVLRRLLASDAPSYLNDLPVFGIWPATLAAQLDRHLAIANTRAVRAWADGVAARRLSLAPGEALVNVNRPADLAALDGRNEAPDSVSATHVVRTINPSP